MKETNIDNFDYTGERMLNHPDSDIYKLHMGRYTFAKKYVKNKVVLDIASGTGYGTNFLAEEAQLVVGVDIDSPTIEYCKKNYKRKNINFYKIHRINFEKKLKKKFDVIVSFETIEHVKETNMFINNLLGYLKPKGIIILSTPNNYEKKFPPENHFHIYEFDIIELLKILKNHKEIQKVELYGQYRTNVYRKKNEIKNNMLRTFIKWLFKSIYNFDLERLGLLKNIEHTNWYKKVGNLQRGYQKDFSIYPINPTDNFINPTDSIYIIHKKNFSNHDSNI